MIKLFKFNKLRGILFASMAGLFALSSVSFADTNTAFTPQQQEALGKYINQYMMDHPELLMKMAQKLRKQQMAKQSAAARQAIVQNFKTLVHDPRAVTRGSKTAPVTIVEFFDYQCSACVATFPQLHKFMATPAAKNVRFVYRSFPFFGPASEYASKAVIAAEAQGKAVALHDAIFKSGLMEGKLNNKAVDAIAAKIPGINMAKLKSDMNAKWVTDEMATNKVMAKAIHLNATPGFVIVPTNEQKITDKNVLFINSALRAPQIAQYVKQVTDSLKNTSSPAAGSPANSTSTTGG